VTSTVGWDEFADAAPELAAAARGLLRRGELDEGMLATVRGDGLPRIHPVYVGFADGRLVTVVLDGSAKLRDLREDGRFALHAHQDPAVPHELLVRGHAVELTGEARSAAAARWSFDVATADGVFELWLAQVTVGERPDADAWPPVYRSWRAPAPIQSPEDATVPPRNA
jgi:hypothetical protein